MRNWKCPKKSWARTFTHFGQSQKRRQYEVLIILRETGWHTPQPNNINSRYKPTVQATK